MESMDLFLAIMFVFIGAAIGSAALCFFEREDKKTWVTGRSACPECHRTLHWYELIPIVSYVIQKGRCRGCKCRIPLYTVLMEVYGGISGFLIYKTITKSKILMAFLLSAEIAGYIVCMIALKQNAADKKER